MGRKRDFKCLSSGAGTHGATIHESLQVIPFGSESSSIWLGYRNAPSRRYLGVFPSFQEVMNRCRQNHLAHLRTAFPHFNVSLRDKRDGTTLRKDSSGTHIRHVCCAACRGAGTECEVLDLEIIPVKISRGSIKEVYLIAYNFYLKGEKMVALLHHGSRGLHYFQKTDGSLSNKIALDSQHSCTNPAPASQSDNGYDTADDSSLTSFESVESEKATESRASPRAALRSYHAASLAQAPPSLSAPPLLSTPPQQSEAPPLRPRSRGFVVVDLTEDEASSPLDVKQEHHPAEPFLSYSPPLTKSSATPVQDLSFASQYAPAPLAEEFGRITTQISNDYSIRIFEIPEVDDLMKRMRAAVKAGDRADLCRVYGALQAFLVLVT